MLRQRASYRVDAPPVGGIHYRNAYPEGQRLVAAPIDLNAECDAAVVRGNVMHSESRVPYESLRRQVRPQHVAIFKALPALSRGDDDGGQLFNYVPAEIVDSGAGL